MIPPSESTGDSSATDQHDSHEQTDTRAAERQGQVEPVDPQPAFHELSQILLGSPLDELLDRVAHLAQRSLPGADEVSVTPMDGDRARSVASTGDLAVHLDERQYDKGFGSSMDAALIGESAEIPNTATEQTYPDSARQARRAAFTNTLSVGLPIPQRTMGALDIDGTHGADFDDDAHALATAFATYAAVALRDIAQQLVDQRGRS